MIQLFFFLGTFSVPHKQFGVSHYKYQHKCFDDHNSMRLKKRRSRRLRVWSRIEIQHFTRESFTETNWNTKLLILLSSWWYPKLGASFRVNRGYVHNKCQVAAVLLSSVFWKIDFANSNSQSQKKKCTLKNKNVGVMLDTFSHLTFCVPKRFLTLKNNFVKRDQSFLDNHW